MTAADFEHTRIDTPLEQRDTMNFDVIIVGAGVAGLSAACRLMQQAESSGTPLSVCVLEKGAEIGAHILSGAVFDPRALNELFPDWQTLGAPLHTPVERDEFYRFDGERGQRLPDALIPPSMHNRGNYIISAGELVRWLGERAEALGVDIFPGFPAQSLLFDEKGGIAGVITGDMGVGHDGQPRATFMPGMALYARYTLFAEGSRGHLGKQLIEHFDLARDSDPQHYAIGFKELWEVPAEQHQPGLVVHGIGWSLTGKAQGGSFLYHGPDRQVMVGLIVDLNYANPWLSPFHEFQQLKHHPSIAAHLEGGQRIGFGARSITKGGYNSLPRMTFPGGLLIGCEAGTLDFSRIKGLHTAMKSGLLAADSVMEALQQEETPDTLADFSQRFEQSWLGDELRRNRNFGPALHRFGETMGGAWNWLDQKLGGRLLLLHDRTRDHEAMETADRHERIEYPRPDNRLSFDKTNSVYLSNTNHDEDQPSHLRLKDDRIPIETNLPRYAEPAQRYCPVGVYEIIEDEQGTPHFRINFQNCIHCKTCDIKDPSQNIVWTPPEGGGGPNYPRM
ncbi:electron transfer flavoprotein-ubiquinone oxidoreductase [Kushneria phosphatilytica]|uniref:electron transfer flavoprotein-ubiquinone oxidoreductase n=1 Tax=Kushneria phosphatilytica TaxID=657387 RepID=UPI0008DA677F|nr:electron transfer flavoprotein-ubiquinone oxidoreductase [Kushneria phosphatilytica]OHV11814.1 electron transfer flavoprotein-ubiquinone oxidoreductase [Kushneria phosphatilytica]